MGHKLSNTESSKSHKVLSNFKKVNGYSSKKDIVVKTANGIDEVFKDVRVVIRDNSYGTDLCEIDIIWEDAGLTEKEYRAKGLYGIYSSVYCKIREQYHKILIYSDHNIIEVE